jgi:hypothetical protein
MLRNQSFFNIEQCAVSASNGFLPSRAPLTELPAVSKLNMRLNQMANTLLRLSVYMQNCLMW